MHMPEGVPDDADNGHHGSVNNVPAAHELALTRNKGELARQTACSPLEEAFACVYHASRVTSCRSSRPSLGSEQQLDPEARHTHERLSCDNLTLSHKKESTQLSKAQACWHMNRYTNWLLFLTSIITM